MVVAALEKLMVSAVKITHHAPTLRPRVVLMQLVCLKGSSVPGPLVAGPPPSPHTGEQIPEMVWDLSETFEKSYYGLFVVVTSGDVKQTAAQMLTDVFFTYHDWM